MAIYVTIDHSKSFQGRAPWVQATPLKETFLLAPGEHTATVFLLHGFANSGAAWEPIAKHLQCVLIPNISSYTDTHSLEPHCLTLNSFCPTHPSGRFMSRLQQLQVKLSFQHGGTPSLPAESRQLGPEKIHQ